MSRLSKEEIMGLKALKKKTQENISNCVIARLFQVSEGTVRYHLKREQKAVDGRGNKPMKATPYAHIIANWFEEHKSTHPLPGIQELYEYLTEEHDYQGHYKSVLRFVRAHYSPSLVRPRRRVELPPGCLAQVDWAEKITIHLGGEELTLHALVMSLAFSRATAVIWSKRKDETSWLRCHNEAFRVLGGIPAVVRCDNVKTAVIKGQGSTATLHPTYQAYARDMGFHIDPARAGKPTDKGKVEAKVKLVKRRCARKEVMFSSLEELQEFTNRTMLKQMERLRSPATGKSIKETLIEERESLRPLPPTFPEPFDVSLTRKVNIDCLTNFEGHSYSVPFQYTRDYVEVRGYPGEVRIFKEGVPIASHPRGTEYLLVIDQSHYEGASTKKVASPEPLGKMTKTLLSFFEVPVEKRAISCYEKLLEVVER